MQKFSYEDIHDLNKRAAFLDWYNKAVNANVAFRHYINVQAETSKK